MIWGELSFLYLVAESIIFLVRESRDGLLDGLPGVAGIIMKNYYGLWNLIPYVKRIPIYDLLVLQISVFFSRSEAPGSHGKKTEMCHREKVLQELLSTKSPETDTETWGNSWPQVWGVSLGLCDSCWIYGRHRYGIIRYDISCLYSYKLSILLSLLNQLQLGGTVL